MNTFHAFCIAAPRSGEGKTTISLALMRLLARNSKRVQAFKCGPDYIDPTFHSLVTNRPCANLDTWMMGSEEVKRVFTVKSQESQDDNTVDISICEGVMGLFDGRVRKLATKRESLSPENTSAQKELQAEPLLSALPPIDGSSAHCARILNIPIVLVVNAKGMASSIAALVTGFSLHAQKYNIKIAGIIANNVGSPRHAEILRNALSEWDLPPLLGFLPRKDEWRIGERQLGLLPCMESEKDMAWADSIADILEENLDVEKLLRVTQVPRPIEISPQIPPMKKKGVLAIARDEAFCFYYEANIKALEYLGWDIIYFSPLHDAHLPKADALYFGGGYPEVFAKELSQNKSMREDVRLFAEANGEIFAECGGYMYLTKELITQENPASTEPQDVNPATISHPMCAVINAVACMGKKMRSLGYREITLHAETIFSPYGESLGCNDLSENNIDKPNIDESSLDKQSGENAALENKKSICKIFRGHEFHWSDIELKEEYAPLAFVDGVAHGVAYKNVRASYLHFYWANSIFLS